MFAWVLACSVALAASSPALPDLWRLHVEAEVWPEALLPIPDLAEAVAPPPMPGALIDGKVTRIACTRPWCLVLIEWDIESPDGTTHRLSTSGGGQGEEAKEAFFEAMDRAVTELDETLDLPMPVEIRDPGRSLGERWMIRGGYVAGAGIILAYGSGLIPPDGVTQGAVAATGALAMVTGLGMAAAGLAIGDGPSSVVAAPGVTPGGGPVFGLVAQLPARRRRR